MHLLSNINTILIPYHVTLEYVLGTAYRFSPLIYHHPHHIQLRLLVSEQAFRTLHYPFLLIHNVRRLPTFPAQHRRNGENMSLIPL